MMKFLIGLLSLLLSINVAAQQIHFSKAEQYDYRNGDYSVVGKVGGLLYTYRANKGNYYLDAYNDSMQREHTVVLDFFPTKIYQTQFINYPDKIIVLYQAIERGKVIQYAALLNEKGLLQGRPLVLDEARTGIFGASGSYFNSAISENKDQIAIYRVGVKNKQLNLSCNFLNSQLEKQGRLEKNYDTHGNEDIQAALLDNAGNLYLPVLSNSKEGGNILVIEKATNQINNHPFSFDGAHSSGLFFKIDNQTNQLYCCGFYAQRKNSTIDGVLFMTRRLDSFESKPVQLLSFSDRLKEATGNGLRRGFNNFQARQLIIRNDGGFVLIAEDYSTSYRNGGMGYNGYYSSYYSPFMMGAQTIREYRYGDIVALSYNAAGQQEFSSFIRKDQYSEEDGGLFSSYAFFNSGGALGFLYNDYDRRRSQITLAGLDASGKIATHALYSVGSSDPDWLPRAGKQISAKELVVPCLEKKQICFAKIVL